VGGVLNQQEWLLISGWSLESIGDVYDCFMVMPETIINVVHKVEFGVDMGKYIKKVCS